MTKLSCAFHVFLVGLLLTACSPAPARVAIAQSEKPRQTASAPAADVTALSEGNLAFAFDLYQALRNKSGNLIVSPYSLSAAIAMTYAGARGDTEAQMAAVLHFSLPQAQLHPAFNALDAQLRAPGDFQLNIANSVWGQADFTFQPDFLDTLAANYGAGLRLVDFKTDESAREAARQAINRWVKDETNAKVDELFKQDAFTDATRLVLANAVYFKADWAKPFYGTTEAAFTRLDGVTVTVPIMTNRFTAPYASTADYQAIAIPYKGDRMQMVIVVPAAGTFADFEQSLTAGTFASLYQSLQVMDVKPYLPKFNYRTSLELKLTLSEMGMPDAFDWQRADFSGMTGQNDLHISSVVQQAVVVVDEQGTEAAAATGIIMELVSSAMMFNATRPFIYVIYDTVTATPLFIGRVLDPSQ